LDRLLRKIDSSVVYKDGKIDVVHDLFEKRQTFCTAAHWRSGQQRAEAEQQVSLISEWVMQQNDKHILK